MRVVIGEDEALMRQGLSLVLERAGLEVAAVAGDGEDLVRKVSAHRPDLAVTDIRMPPGHTDEGLRAALEIRARLPHTAILVLSHHVQRRYAIELLERTNGAGVGYLLKQRVTDVDAFCADVRRICDGASVLDPEVVSLVLAQASPDGPLSRLTARQLEVLELMAQGRSNAAIAERLVISEKAVVRHVSHIYGELDLRQSPDDHRRVLAVLQHLSRSSDRGPPR
jgi:DNA-binding NarL/FixJ family response regulator